MANLKRICKKEENFTGGHRLCAGCGAGIIARQAMIAAAGKPVVVTARQAALKSHQRYFRIRRGKSRSSIRLSRIRPRRAAELKRRTRSLKKQGKLSDDIRFIAFGGDGGTYDIGLQSLSGAMETQPQDALHLLQQRSLYEYRHSAFRRNAKRRPDNHRSGGKS